VRRGSFAATARDHDVAPSSISRAIATLESELATRLFQRTTRSLTLTEAGASYFDRIAPLLEQLQEAGAAIADAGHEPRGTLRATASVSFGQKCVLPILPELLARHPNLSLDLVLTDAVVDLVSERIDVAVRLGRLPDSSLIAQKLIDTPYVICASPDYLRRHGRPRRPADIARHECLLFPFTGFRSHWTFVDRRGRRETVPVAGRTVISNAMALQEAARTGMGLALLSRWLTDDDLAAGKLVDMFPSHRVTATDFKSAAWLVYPSRAYLPSKVRVFAEALRKHMKGAGNGS
jgi:DNA-binding transcriptional LysR family regulator